MLQLVLLRLRLAAEEVLPGLHRLLADRYERSDRVTVELSRPEDDRVDDLRDRRSDRVDDRAHLVRERAEVDELREELDRDLQRAGERALDLQDGRGHVAGGDRADRVEHGVDEVCDLLRLLDDEHHDLVDRLAGLDERAHGCQERENVVDPGLDDALGDVLLDLPDHEVLEVGELLLDLLPQPADAVLCERDEDVDRLLEARDHRLAEVRDGAFADPCVRQPEHLQDEVHDSGEVELRRHRDPFAPELAEEQVEQGLLQVDADSRDEALETAADGVDQRAEEAARVRDNVADRLRGLDQHAKEHLSELVDRLRDADRGVDRLVDEPLVLLLQLLDARVERRLRVDILLRDRLDEVVALPVDVRLERVEVVVERRGGLAAELPERRGQLLFDVRVHLGASGQNSEVRQEESDCDEVRDLVE